MHRNKLPTADLRFFLMQMDQTSKQSENKIREASSASNVGYPSATMLPAITQNKMLPLSTPICGLSSVTARFISFSSKPASIHGSADRSLLGVARKRIYEHWTLRVKIVGIRTRGLRSRWVSRPAWGHSPWVIWKVVWLRRPFRKVGP